MALIDVLPQFKYKPLDLRVPASKLVQKPAQPVETTPPEPAGNTGVPDTTAEISTVPSATDLPTVTPESTPTQANPKLSVLPGKYEVFQPLMTALNDSTIKNEKAKMAVLAQMRLEKGWSAPKDFNYGNITTGKTWKGAFQERGDHDASGNPIVQKFRSYGSPKEFVDDYIGVLKRKYPLAYAELHSQDFDIDRFTSGLIDQPSKYAEDPAYKSKVKGAYSSVLSAILGNK